jgi:crotonobetainyl-CoA:carnitine CoA-transferase CaiB-like acyl-CoA transferase
MTEASAPRATELLSDVTVLQLGGSLRLAYGGRLLADLGADVVVPSQPERARSSRRALLDAFLDHGKRVSPLPSEGSRREVAVAELARSATVALVDVHDPHAAEDLDATDDVLPRLCVRDTPTSTVGSPPMPELLLQAQAGWVYRRGPVPHPVRVGGRLADFSVGAYVAVGALVALAEAETAPAATVELCALESLYTTLPLSRFYRGPQTNPGLDAGPPGILRCADGWVGINCLTGQHWEDLCTLLGLDEHTTRLPDIKASEHQLTAFREQIPQWFVGQPAAEIVSVCQAMRIPSAPVGTGTTMPFFEHWVARGSIASTEIEGRSLPSPRSPYRVRGRAAAASQAPPQQSPSVPGLPFAGYRVLDLGSFWAAPYLTCLLGALGADVLKIEGPRRPDGFRYFGVSPSDGELWYESGAAWQATNLNKRGVAVDLTRPEGRELLLRLAEGADVMIENFSPRVIEQFGLDHASLAERNPRISLMRMPAYGIDGPWRDYVGWAATFEEIGGLAEVTGFPEGPPNIPGGQSDPIAGLHAAVAVLAAMRRGRRTGAGYDLEVATSDVMLYLAAEQLLDSADRGVPTTRQGNEGADLVAESVDGDDTVGWQARVEAPGATACVSDVIAAHSLPGRLERDGAGVTTRFPVVGAPEGRVFLNWPLHVGGGRLVQHAGPPRLGEHTETVLSELGLDDSEVAKLAEEGVVLLGRADPGVRVGATEVRRTN